MCVGGSPSFTFSPDFYSCLPFIRKLIINIPYTSKFRKITGGHRIRAPCDLAGDAFETRVRAFFNGRFWELLNTSFDVTNHPHLPQNQTHTTPPTPPQHPLGP